MAKRKRVGEEIEAPIAPMNLKKVNVNKFEPAFDDKNSFTLDKESFTVEKASSKKESSKAPPKKEEKSKQTALKKRTRIQCNDKGSINKTLKRKRKNKPTL